MNAQTTTNQRHTDIKRLYLSTVDKKVSGVCGGIGEYFETDSTLIRLAWIFFTVITGIVPGMIAYIIAAIVVPHAPPEGVDHA